jgi:hypothetical protein
MATAAVISYEETRQAFAKTRARQQLHAYLEGWVDGLEAHMPARPVPPRTVHTIVGEVSLPFLLLLPPLSAGLRSPG